MYCSLSFALALIDVGGRNCPCTRMRTRTYTHIHAHTHTYTCKYTHAHAKSLTLSLSCAPDMYSLLLICTPMCTPCVHGVQRRLAQKSEASATGACMPLDTTPVLGITVTWSWCVTVCSSVHISSSTSTVVVYHFTTASAGGLRLRGRGA